MLVGIETGPTGANDGDSIYMSRATGEEWVGHVARSQAEYSVVFMKDQNFAYYNSRAARKAPNLGDRDLLAECVAAGKRHGIPIVAYCQVQYDDSSWHAHPEWRMKDGTGADIGGRLCYNSGYIEAIKTFLGELMEYDVVGFHVDMLDFGFGKPYGCWCDACRKLFRDAYHIDMPPGPTWDEAWEQMLQFRYDSNTRFCHEVREFVRSRKPHLSVDFNYHGYPPFSWEAGERPVQHAVLGDFVTAEGLPWIFGHTNVSLLPLFLQGAVHADGRSGAPDHPVQVATSHAVYVYHDYTIKPIAETKWEVMTYLAHGAQCTMVDKAFYDGTVDPIVYDRLAEVYGEARKKREYFQHPPLQEVGLYYSARSRDWYGREDRTRYYAAFVGAHRALVQAHVPLGMIHSETVSAERLRSFPIVYIPNAPVLTDPEIALLTDYVRDGGNLLVTGLTGIADRSGNLTDRCSISNLIGARLVRLMTEHHDNYIKLPRDPNPGGAWLLPNIPPDWALLTYGPCAGFEPTTAQGFGELLIAHRSLPGVPNLWMNHMSPAESIGPAVLVNRLGKGAVVTVPASVDAAFADRFRSMEHRNLIANIVRHLNPSPPVVIEAPRNVETVVTQDAGGKRLLVQFLAWWAPPTADIGPFEQGRRVLPPVMEETFEYSASVIVNRPFHAARASRHRPPEAPAARVHVAGNKITLSTRAIHEVLEIAV
jgi:hypothetical protein